MSVYTQVTQKQLLHFLAGYDLGELIDYQGILAGIENTNFFVDTSQGRFVLTLFEQHKPRELPYFLQFMAYLAEHDIPSAHPIADQQGHYLSHLNGKPAALVQRLKGKDVKQPNVAQCRSLAHYLAKIHQISPDFSGFRSNDRGADWWYKTAQRVMPRLGTDEKRLLSHELDYQSKQQFSNLTVGVIHADLFRDNALFEGDELRGIIDFYCACNDYLLYDVAVTVNDWCVTPAGQMDETRLYAFLDIYQQIHPFDGDEKQAWPQLLRAAALRFWLSRLQDFHFPRDGELTQTKEPKVFQNILSHHITQPQVL